MTREGDGGGEGNQTAATSRMNRYEAQHDWRPRRGVYEWQDMNGNVVTFELAALPRPRRVIGEARYEPLERWEPY
jgi:hypothetical protein